MRLVLRIGGSVVASPVNTTLMNEYIDLLKKMKIQGHELAVVVGGGTLAREFISIACNLGLEIQEQDEIAISVSRLFAQLILNALGEAGCSKVAYTLDDAVECFGEGKIMVMGGLKPGITTDAVAALVAERLDAQLLVKGTNQEGVYNKDPQKFSDAHKLDRLTYEELSNVLELSEHKAGMHQIIDPIAIEVLKRKQLKLIVVNGFKLKNIQAAINGESVGTTIH